MRSEVRHLSNINLITNRILSLMPISMTEEQVLASAPDDASRKSGRDLANLQKWVSTGRSETALWGACKGSGSKPYQTQVDLSQLAFKCSCPSRKFPCKHGLGLLLIYSRQPNTIPEESSPEWVNEWLSKRQVTAEKKAEKLEEAVASGNVTARKNTAARESKVSEGIADLHKWLKDMIRNGLLQLPEKKSAYWDTTSRRLIDAQAPGLAAMVRNLAETNFYTEGWQQDFMHQLLRLYVTSEGYNHLEDLPETLQEDIRQLCGFTISQDYLKSLPGIHDNWLILGKQVSEQDKLTTERYWLYGESSHRTALILQFYTKQVTTPALTLSPGTAIKAELAWYPSAHPLRAVIKEHRSSWSPMQAKGMHSWMEVVQAQTAISQVQPVFHDQLYIVEQLLPVQYQGRWYLSDSAQQLMPLKPSFNKLWKLLAVTGGQPMTMAVTGCLQQYEPLGVWDHSHYQLL
ncbi:SWIM zinc finger protein [Chitinophaga dinghuensis]|uniref:SWIM zinc finger protein n=2 Tax=Chitinophaga dinghuensis TaxID=1539050 RepID=A0A327VQR5_9BACT|nr:SWIM zinc finger protein [Chitinophaga dinghuensis]